MQKWGIAYKCPLRLQKWQQRYKVWSLKLWAAKRVICCFSQKEYDKRIMGEKKNNSFLGAKFIQTAWYGSNKSMVFPMRQTWAGNPAPQLIKHGKQ